MQSQGTQQACQLSSQG